MHCRARGRKSMSIQRPPNQLLQALPAEEFEVLAARLKPLQMVKETQLIEAGQLTLSSVGIQISLP